MKEMKVGDKVLFYHSNCKNPGIAGFAEVSKEAYPDYTAWDASHPYYDEKTDRDNPKWYMVDVTFVSRAAYFVPLSLLRKIASSSEVPEEVEYIGEEGAQAIKGMALVTRGRLSVQRVEEAAWTILEQMAERGGWEKGGSAVRKTKAQPKASGKRSRGKKSEGPEEVEDEDALEERVVEKPVRRKRKVEETGPVEEISSLRRSTRARR
ncbi:PUA-like domain-containing protein [Daedaleopsis nitida]|nr:PUA-like domain-containing protein [Daedaleopsis nitida]